MLQWQALEMAKREAPRYSLFLKIGTTDPVYLWTGIGPYQASSDDDIAPNAVFNGAGILRSIPGLKQLMSGTADRVQFSFSGVDLKPVSWMSTDGSILNAEVNVGIVFFDTNWQAVAPIAWFWDGTSDVVSSSYDALTKTINLSVVSGYADRQRSDFRYWTDASHQSRHPGDLFCQRTAIYSIGTESKWPP